MQLLGLKDRRDIVAVIDYLVEIHQKNDTVEDVMEKFGLSPEEYRMCCDLAMPALRQGNIKGRFTAVSRTNKAMRKGVKALYEMAKDGDGPLEKAVKLMYETYCLHTQNVVYGQNKDDAP